MASRTQITLIDDLDGSPATQTVTFAYEGRAYEIDLHDDHAKALEESFSDWIAAARPLTSGKLARRTASRTPPRGGNAAAVRGWLLEQGHEVSDRGRIRAELQRMYDEAH